jgi:hypothetical protein
MGNATQKWKDLIAYRSMLSDSCTEGDIAVEAIWIQDTLTEVLNQYAKPIQLTPYSKRWWGTEVKEARGVYARTRKLWQTGTIGDAEHREARKIYYMTIRRAKRECWETFLGGPQENKESLDFEDSARYWTALKYTKPRTDGTTPTLRGGPPRE